MEEEIHELAIKIASNVDGLERDQVRAERALLNMSRQLQRQADTFGLSKQAARIYQLEQRGVREEIVASAKAAAESVAALDRKAAAEQHLAGIMQRGQTLAEKLTQEQIELTRAFKAGDLATDQYAAGLASLNRQMDKTAITAQLVPRRPQISAGNVAMGAFAGGNVSVTGGLNAMGPVGIGAAAGVMAGTKAWREMAGVVQDLSQQSAEFERTFTRSMALAGGVTAEMEGRMIAAAESAAVYSGSLTKQAEAYQFLFAAGLSQELAIASQMQVTKFATAGNFDLALATDLATDAQSALGLKSAEAMQHQENLARVTDVVAAAYTLSNATIEQFSTSITNKAGSAARLAGKDVEELTAVLAVFADQGVKGEEAGTAVNIVWRDMARAAIDNEAAWSAAGVAVFDAQGQFRNTADIIGELEQRLDGMSDKEKRVELATLGFTDKSIAFTSALLGTSEAMRGYEEQLDRAGGTVDRLANESITELDKASRQLNLAWEKLANDIGPVVNEELAEATVHVTELIAGFDGLGESVRPLAHDIGAAVESLAELAALQAQVPSTPLSLSNFIPGGTALAVGRSGLTLNAAIQDQMDPEVLDPKHQQALDEAREIEGFDEISAAHQEFVDSLQPWQNEQDAILAGYAAIADEASAAAAAQGDYGQALSESDEALAVATSDAEAYLATLREQIDTCGKSAEALELERAARAGVSIEIQEQIGAEQLRLALMEGEAEAAKQATRLAEEQAKQETKLNEDLDRQADAIKAKQRTDTEKLIDREKELQQLVGAGKLTGAQAGRELQDFAKGFTGDDKEKTLREVAPRLITAGSKEDFELRHKILGDAGQISPQQKTVELLGIIKELMQQLVRKEAVQFDIKEEHS